MGQLLLIVNYLVFMLVISGCSMTKDQNLNKPLRNIIYSGYSDECGNDVIIYLIGKKSITCETNHISIAIPKIDPERIILTASGGSLLLLNKESLSYLYEPNCSSGSHKIYISRRKANGVIVLMKAIEVEVNR